MMDWFAYKDVAPRRAAAGILLTPDAEPRILLGRRNDKLKFMGGHHVFPGGRAHDDDEARHVTGIGDADRARLIVAVAREVFEETGLLCSRRVRPDLEALRAARKALLAGERGFGGILDEFHCVLDGAAFIPAGNWITPPFSPIRFDTQYFAYVYDGPLCEEVSGPDAEIVQLDWLTARAARRRWHAGGMRLSTPVAFVLQHLEAFPLDEALPFLNNPPGHESFGVVRFEMRRGIHIIPAATQTLPPATHTNCVAVGQHDLYVVDPGPVEEADRERLAVQIDRLAALGGKVAAILLTHSHPDHTGAADFLRARYGAPVWAHADTARQLRMPVERLLAHGEVLESHGDPGWRLRCIHTPGHDPGHLCFLEETTRTLLIGDMVANPGTIVISAQYEGDMTAYLASLDALLREEFSLTVPAHGLPLGGPAGKDKIRELIAHRLDREAKIKAALDAGAATTEALLEQAYADTPVELWPLAEHQLDAHLVRLGVAL